jgi:predicted phosphodiesterase
MPERKMPRTIVGPVLLFSILFSLYIGGCGGASKSVEEDPLRFAVIGDRTGTAQPGIYEQIIEDIQKLEPDFLLTVGDMIEGPAPDTIEILRRWEEYGGIIKTITSPVYYVPGNNDIWDSTSLEFFRRYAAEPHYSFNVRGVHFIVLDNSRFYTVDDFPKEQIDWLIDDLQKHQQADYTIVSFHIPFWVKTIAEGKPDTLHSLFRRYGVDAVFTGHFHYYFSGEYDGIKYTGMGSSGGEISNRLIGPEYHFSWVTIDADGISIAPIVMGAVLPWDEVTVAQMKLARKMKNETLNIERIQAGKALSVPQTQIDVTITNLSGEVAINDTLTWETPSGWSVSPMSMPVEVEPGASSTVKFNVKCTGPLYPTPTLSLRCPYAEEKLLEISQTLSAARTVYAYPAKETPNIDGKLTETIWKDPTTKLFGEDGSAMPTEPVNFYFAWDQDNLYLAARCTETKMEEVAAKTTDHDGPVYGEDCVGYFLQPGIDDDPMFQIYFNPLGTAFDQKVKIEGGVAVDADRGWNGTYDVKSFQGNDYWSMEARIHLDQLETKGEPGKSLQLNFRRKQKRLNAAADWMVPLDYNPKDYGVLIMK